MANTTIPSELIAADAITGAKIADNAVDSEHYTDGSIDTAHIADSQVTVGKMAANSVDSDQYVDASIDRAHIADDAVNSEHIADDAVNSQHYVDGSIDTAHIADSQITVAKMAANSVDSDQYVDGSIDTAHIADNQITLAKMAGGTDGNIISFDASGDPVAIATGSDGQVLTSTGAGSPPAFEDAGGGAVSAVANGANNRIATFSSGDALNGEANMTFDGTDLVVAPGGNTRFNVQANETHFFGSDVYFNAGTGSGLGNKYFNINGGTGRDGGFIFKRNNANIWQLAPDPSSDDDFNFYSYGTNSTVFKIDKSDGKVVASTRFAVGTAGVVYSSGETQTLNAASFGLGVKAGDTPLGLWSTAGSGTLIAFASTGNGSAAGSISFSGGTAAYNTTSDYRLKENVDYTWDATTRLKQLKPARFNWISDDSNTLIDGFLAHEVSSIVPEAVLGTKDETETFTNAVVNSAGIKLLDNITEAEWTAGKIPTLWTEDNTLPEGVSVGDVKTAALYESDTTWTSSHTQNLAQQMDASKLIPLLVKTIQELEARITTLEG